MTLRARVVLRIARALGVEVCLGDPEAAHDHLRRVDPLLASELATVTAETAPEGVCAICGGGVEPGKCSATMDFEQDSGFGWDKRPLLSLHAHCRGMQTKEEAVERLWYWLRVKIPAKKKKEAES